MPPFIRFGRAQKEAHVVPRRSAGAAAGEEEEERERCSCSLPACRGSLPPLGDATGHSRRRCAREAGGGANAQRYLRRGRCSSNLRAAESRRRSPALPFCFLCSVWRQPIIVIDRHSRITPPRRQRGRKGASESVSPRGRSIPGSLPSKGSHLEGRWEEESETELADRQDACLGGLVCCVGWMESPV